MLVQPFQADIARTGEDTLMVFGGRYTHAVRKVPKAGDFRVRAMTTAAPSTTTRRRPSRSRSPSAPRRRATRSRCTAGSIWCATTPATWR